ncbi:restriction endonuclease subunit S [Streptomyces cellulosae]|uniref:Restriction endonuclease subunit S n=1 Tax=Streptomyces cellulosae TaxID=1968 RepID=A0ABW6JCP2_STRCE
MSDWSRAKLEDLAKPGKNALATGPFGSSIGSRFFREDGVPVIRGSNLSLSVGERLVDSEIVFVDEEKAQEFPRSVARRGDLVFTCWGTIGQVGLIDERSRFDRYIVSNKQMKMTPDPATVDSLFLYYALSSPECIAQVQGVSIGSSVPGFNLTQLRQIEVPFPALPEQRAVASVLGALDDKIAVNERIAATADQLAGALFQACPSRAPRLITEVASITMGQSPSGETYNENGDGLPFYQGNRDFGLRYPGHRIWCTAVTRHAYENDVLVSVRAPVGAINVAAETCGIGRGVAAVRSVEHPHVLLHALSSDPSVWRPYEAEGTVFGSINKRQFSQLQVSWPGESVVDVLEEQLKALDDRLRQVTKENRTLATLRDTLLPQLMSGRLRVKDAEKIVEDAT